MVALNDDEVSSYAKELARVTAQQAELEDEKKAATSGFKNRIDRCVADCRALAQKVTTRRELRDIDCEWGPAKDGKMQLTRMGHRRDHRYPEDDGGRAPGEPSAGWTNKKGETKCLKESML